MMSVILASVVFASPASADGLPVQDLDLAQPGIDAPAEDVRYAVSPAGADTVVHRMTTNGAQVLASRLLRGRYAIPVVAYDGSAAGLSADGGTLVLINPRRTFPRAKTSFAVLATSGLELRETLTLSGDFSFDAVSPNARWLYLIHYTHPKNPVQYQVRALDLLNGKLHPDPIVDPREPDEAMNGHPLTRATSQDGRWAYTLYEGSEHPFVHALDTVNRDARCVDLDWLHGRKDLGQMRLDVAAGGRDLRLRAGGEDAALVDLQTFEARAPAHGSSLWKWLLLPAGGLLLAGVFAYRAGSRAVRSDG